MPTLNTKIGANCFIFNAKTVIHEFNTFAMLNAETRSVFVRGFGVHKVEKKCHAAELRSNELRRTLPFAFFVQNTS